MSKIGLVPYEKFDLAAYTNYGTSHYDRGESEASSHEKLALKGKSLQALTRPTIVPTAAAAPSPAAQDLSLSQLNAAISRTPNRPELYETRALWFSKRGIPEQAHIDACRALWLGSRNQETLALKKALENYMAKRKASISALKARTN